MGPRTEMAGEVVTTHFTTAHILGKGRGKFLGYPTLNMQIPADFELESGIYAAWVTVAGTRFRGALHWGPIPTFDDAAKSLEVFLLGVGEHELSHADTSLISVEIVKKLRDVVSFASVDELTEQIGRDVAVVHRTLVE